MGRKGTRGGGETREGNGLYDYQLGAVIDVCRNVIMKLIIFHDNQNE